MIAKAFAASIGLQIYGDTGANPAHGRFVAAPAAWRDGKTVGLSRRDCRRLLEAPSADTPIGIRDRAILAVLAYSACRVGELVRLKVGDFKMSGEQRVLNVLGKGGKERIVPFHLEAVERLGAWLDTAHISDDRPNHRPREGVEHHRPPRFRWPRQPRAISRFGESDLSLNGTLRTWFGDALLSV